MRIRRMLNAIAHPITEYRVRKAKGKHRERFPFCAMCKIKATFWGRNNDVHHIEPVHVNPERACDPRNLITFCRMCHFMVGHFGNWRDWNGGIEDTVGDLGQHYIGLKDKYRRTDQDEDISA